MKQSKSSIFTQLRNEDRRYGEKPSKDIPKVRREKNGFNFKNMKPSDLIEDDFGEDFDKEDSQLDYS